MQQAGVEWVHRLVQEPARLWRRYVVDLVLFTSFFLRQWWLMRGQAGVTPLLPHTEVLLLEDKAVLNVEGRLTADNCRTLLNSGQETLAVTPVLVVNLARAEFLDSSAIGVLVNLTKQARERNGEVTLVETPPLIRQTFNLLRLDTYFTFCDHVQEALEATTPAKAQDTAQDKPGALPTPAGGRWQVLSVPRRLDHVTAPELSRSWCSALVASRFLILDFSQTVLVTSAGLALLAQLHRTACNHEGELRLVNCSRDVRRVMEMVRFDRMLDLYPNMAAALG
jgi:anti-anti-sigma factor